MKTHKQEFVETSLRAQTLLHTPLLNKGTAFTLEERASLGLHGLLPPHVSTIEEQVQRRYKNFSAKTKGMNKYLFLKHLQDRNEILFYRLALEYSEETLPYIYTPTVGDASLDYSNLYAENRGVYISYDLRDKMDEIFQNIPHSNIDAIVATDGSRILGLGDVGVGGMTIPIGKLSLYTLFGGIHPGKTLPIMLDVGTDNQRLLADPLYIGSNHPRIKGKEYEEFIEQFVQTIKKRFPGVLLQWEDFSKEHAKLLLDRYRNVLCSFNDDIQGTASVVLSAVLAALKSNKETLAHQKIAILGGGSAGLGIAHYLVQTMVLSGISEQEAYSKFFIVDIKGLIHNKLEGCDPNQVKFAQNYELVRGWKTQTPGFISLEDTVEHAKPTILLGVSAQPNTFTQKIVEKMSSYCKRPIIFPLSNPTSRAEANPKDLITWSKGQAIVATGSPSEVVEYNQKKSPIGQCNNVYIFPGVGLGIIASKTTRVTDQMFLKAANVLSDYAPILQDPHASLFPAIKDLRGVTRKIGIEVAQLALAEGTAQRKGKNPEEWIDETIWHPNYPVIKPQRSFTL
jgi:malate dehydrogenase (oxaloacetate-decarboxylating)